MKGKDEIKLSLYLEVFLMVFLAGMVSILFFMGFNFILEQVIDEYHENHNLVQIYNEKYIRKLQDYVTEQQVSVRDTDKLDTWIQNNKIIYIQIMKDREWIYSSDFDIDKMQSEEYDILPYSLDRLYDVIFADGKAQVYIMGIYSYNAYMITFILDIAVSVLLFMILSMLGIREKIRYINRLSKDIEILEGGDLDYEVHVAGSDELARLAKGLNAMKTSFRNQIEEVENLTKANQEMITEISHDLRTPLTSVLLYVEILKSGKCKDEENRQKYLDKILKKIQYLKELSDGLLAYSVHSVEERYIPAEYIDIHSAVYDELSDMCQYLKEQGMKVQVDLKWQKGQILLYEKYLVRILDNISSNILKYADKKAPVLIWDEYYEDEMCITFENVCYKGNRSKDGYNIGIRNVKTMVKEMDGRCDVTQTEDVFRLCIRLRYREENK